LKQQYPHRRTISYRHRHTATTWKPAGGGTEGDLISIQTPKDGVLDVDFHDLHPDEDAYHDNDDDADSVGDDQAQRKQEIERMMQQRKANINSLSL
jgi:hypothetical protein